MKFNSLVEAAAAFESHRPQFEARGIYLEGARTYTTDAVKQDWTLAMDALPALSTDPNSAIPALLTTLIDPQVYAVLFAAVRAAEIYGEARKGTWTDSTAMFPTVEQTAEVSSYGDYNNNGRAGANYNFPQRQNYLFQTIPAYGELEIAKAGLARINWVGEIDKAAMSGLMRFLNNTYFFGMLGLQNYGVLNDPDLSTPISPATKAYGGVKWINSGVIVASPNEVYNDIVSIYLQLVTQAAGLVDQETKLVLVIPTISAIALSATNSFGINVRKLLKENYPNIRIETAVQLGVTSSTNPNGVAAGNQVQMFAEELEGQRTVQCAFSDKMRTFPIVRELSSWKKKMLSGTWGAVIRQPFAVASMLGV